VGGKSIIQAGMASQKGGGKKRGPFALFLGMKSRRNLVRFGAEDQDREERDGHKRRILRLRFFVAEIGCKVQSAIPKKTRS